jgi:CRISPR-associated protein Cas2
MLLVTRTVNVETAAGRKRCGLSRAPGVTTASGCRSPSVNARRNQRKWTALRARLIAEIDPKIGSLRLYDLGAKVEGASSISSLKARSSSALANRKRAFAADERSRRW